MSRLEKVQAPRDFAALAVQKGREPVGGGQFIQNVRDVLAMFRPRHLAAPMAVMLAVIVFMLWPVEQTVIKLEYGSIVDQDQAAQVLVRARRTVRDFDSGISRTRLMAHGSRERINDVRTRFENHKALFKRDVAPGFSRS